MIAIAAQLGAPILFMPIAKNAMIIVASLAPLPAIKNLVHYDKSHPVSQIEQLRRGRIVRRADGVAAKITQNFKLTLQPTQIDRRTERAKIGMVAYAVERHAFPIEQKTVVRREFNRPNAKIRLVAINHFTVFLKRRDGSIKIWMPHAPAFRIRQMTRD